MIIITQAINVSEMTKSAQARHKTVKEAALEELKLQNVDRDGADIACCGRPFQT